MCSKILQVEKLKFTFSSFVNILLKYHKSASKGKKTFEKENKKKKRRKKYLDLNQIENENFKHETLLSSVSI